MERLSAILHRFGFLITLALFGVAVLVLYEALKRHDLGEIIAALRALKPWQVFAALGLTAGGYLTLIGYDYLAFVYLRHPLAPRKVALAAFVGYAFSNTVGHSLLSGGSVRFRLYSAWGLSPVEISKLLLFCFATFHLGMWALEGGLFMAYPARVGEMLHIGPVLTFLLGAVLLGVVIGYVIWTVVRDRPIRIKRLELEVPSLPVTLAQIIVVGVDVLLSAAVVYVLVPERGDVGLGAFVAVYLVALLAGYISQMPGGLGVLEGMMLILLRDLDETQVLGAMLAYRVIYGLLPLTLAAIMLGIFEVRRSPEVSRMAQIGARSGTWLAPNFLAAATFVAGGILLLSGSTPTVPGRLLRLQEYVPLSIIEAAHFLASVVGLLLLVLAQALRLRVGAAYYVTAALLATASVLCLLKGFEHEEAITLAVILAALLPCRRHFFRDSSLRNLWFSPQWFAAVGAAILASATLAYVAYHGTGLGGRSWWNVELDAEAPRSLRALVGVAVLGLTLAVANLLRPAPPRPRPPGDSELDRAQPIVAASPRSAAHLALLGDKPLLGSRTGEAFIMYAVSRRTWVALGDPVGPESQRKGLAWDFRELARRNRGKTVFYEVLGDHLDVYLDLGLTALKLGEEGRVSLERWREGPAHGALRAAVTKVERDGCTFEVVPREQVPAHLSEIRAVCDAWGRARGVLERGFAQGYFSERYLRRMPVALVRRRGRIVALAALWLGARRDEMSCDLLRTVPEAPRQVMDFLVVRTIAWGAREGYRWLTLGTAPLPDESPALAPFFSRVGNMAFRFGDHFDSAQKLRDYLEQFGPAWTPRYVALPGGLSMAHVLRDLATLVSEGAGGS